MTSNIKQGLLIHCRTQLHSLAKVYHKVGSFKSCTKYTYRVPAPKHNHELPFFFSFSWHFLNFLFSVDTRDSNFAQGTHWSDETYRERLSFHVEGRAGTLTIKSTTEDDTGEYRCRVDFQKSPTRNSKVNLTVISKY